MAEATVRAQVNQTLDRELNFAAQVTFDGVLADGVADAFKFRIGQILDLLGMFDAAGIQNLHRARTTDAIDGSQTDHGVLLRRNVNTGNTSHLCLPQLALTLLVTRVFADHSHNTLALDDLAVAAHFLD